MARALFKLAASKVRGAVGEAKRENSRYRQNKKRRLIQRQTQFRPNEVNSSLQVRRADGEQGGISGPQAVCVTLKFSVSASVIFPATNSQVEVGNNAARADVKGAERIVFQRLLVRRFDFYYSIQSVQKSVFHPKTHTHFLY